MRLRPENTGGTTRASRSSETRRTLGIAGVVAGTNILTDGGWLPIEEVSEGDRVITQEGQPQCVTLVRRRVFGSDLQLYWPRGLIYVPDRALGPAEAFYLLPDQTLMVAQDIAKTMFDDPKTLVPAEALVGVRGITRVMPIDLIEVTEMRLEDAAIVECQGGVWLRCPGRAARVPVLHRRRAGFSPKAGAA